jgi:hypothetical protein
MTKRFFICAVIFLAILTLGILAYANLEIYSRAVPVFPSREAITNDYFALERWLTETGHPVRIEKKGNLSRIASGAEKTAFVQASACSWENAGPILMPWIKQGGFLLVSLDCALYDDELAVFLAGLGITQDDYPSENDNNEEIGETAGVLAEMDNQPEETPVPDFCGNVSFIIDKTKAAGAGAEVFAVKDNTGAVRLVRLSLGEGALALTCRPRFMFNNYLERETNARLAWDLTGGRTSAENPGLLFIREKRVTKGLLGKIADRGNFFPATASALMLILLGFWMVIPVFGLTFSKRRNRARPIRERFLAEIRFFKKHGALRLYLETYIRELRLRRREKEAEEIEQALRSEPEIKYRNIINSLRKLECLTERL